MSNAVGRNNEDDTVAVSAMESAPWGATAFVQDARGNVLQSLSVPAKGCTAAEVH